MRKLLFQTSTWIILFLFFSCQTSLGKTKSKKTSNGISKSNEKIHSDSLIGSNKKKKTNSFESKKKSMKDITRIEHKSKNQNVLDSIKNEKQKLKTMYN
jgi:hypothetical protein